MMKNALLLLTLPVVVASGCQSNEVMESKNVAQSEIHQAYTLTYDQAEEYLTVNAGYRVAGPNGTTLVLSEPSDARCNGEEMKLDTYLLGGAYYTCGKAEKITASKKVDVEFLDLDKKSYKNSFEVFALTVNTQESDLPILETGRMNRLTLNTPPLEHGEILILSIEGDSITLQQETTQTYFEIPPGDLARFGRTEKLTIRAERVKSGTLPHGTARGGTYRVTTLAKPVQATVR